MRFINLSSRKTSTKNQYSLLVHRPKSKLENFRGVVKRKTWIFAALLIIPTMSLFAAFDVEPGNTRSLSLGGCICADPDPIAAALGNPAGLSSIRSLTTEMGYQQLYNLPELSLAKFVLVHPLAGGGIGMNLRSFGNDIYREIEAEISYGASLGTLASLGATVGYYWLSIQDYGSDGDVSLSIGIQAKPLSNLIWGMWGRNLIEGHIGESSDPLPQETVTGVSYKIGQNLFTLFDISKEPRYPETYKFGIEAFLSSYLVARVGMQHQPDRAGLGFGVIWNAWQIDYGAATHMELGWTHSISLRWGTK